MQKQKNVGELENRVLKARYRGTFYSKLLNDDLILKWLDEAKQDFPECPTPDSAIIWYKKWLGE